MHHEPAVIFRHPSSPPPVLHDPRDPLVLVVDPIAVPSTLYAPEHPTHEQMEILDVTNGLFALIQKYGAKRVAGWVKNLAILAGEDI